MDYVHTAHAATRQFAIEALGADASAIVVVDWAVVGIVAALGCALALRTCRQGIGLLADVGELGGAVVRLLQTFTEVIERTWCRLMVAIVCAVASAALLHAAFVLYRGAADGRDVAAIMDDAHAAATDAAQAAQAAAAPVLKETAAAATTTSSSWLTRWMTSGAAATDP